MRHWSEEVARVFLVNKNYTILETNYTIRGGEVDIIAQDSKVLVFVEVKQRSHDRYGTAAEAITAPKQARLQEVALHYMSTVYNRDDIFIRFEAVLVSGSQENYTLEHIPIILT